MKIVFLTSRFPYPPYRGDRLRAYNQIKYLAARHESVLVSFVQSKDEVQQIEAVTPFCRRVVTVYLSTMQSVAKCIPAMLTKDPFQVAYFGSGKMRGLLAGIVETERPDIIHTHLVRMAPYTAAYRNIPRVLDLTDAVSLYLDRFRHVERHFIKKRILEIEFERLRSYEAVLSRFDRVVVCSEPDRRFLLKNQPLAAIDIVPNGVDLHEFSVEGEDRSEEGRITFAGNMTYYPNADGAEYFVRRIFPMVKREIRGATLHLVGQNPPSRVRNLQSGDVHVTGFVKDIRSEYVRSSVVVSPVRFGAGTPNKVLEPLALGRPVVSTSVGTEGLQLRDGEEIFIRDNPEAFAEAVIRLLKDPNLRKTISGNVLRDVRPRLSMEVAVTALENVYHEVLHSHVHVKKN